MLALQLTAAPRPAPPAEALRTVLPSGLEQEEVVQVAAGRHFSAAVTGAGEVWTFGACYNGSLGSHSSWSTSAQVGAGVEGVWM